VSRRVVILGATSAIAEQVARRFAAAGDRLYLLARNGERLEAVARDLGIRGAAAVHHAAAPLDQVERHRALLDAAWDALGGVDILLVAWGTLPDQRRCEADVDETLRQLHVNAGAVIALLTDAANRFAAQGHGTLAAISSVAGDRGRQSNYVYGTAKGALSVFLQGLRNRLHRHGVRVVTIKPGFVDTPMTAAFPKGPLWASPERVGRAIHRALLGGPDVVYVPWFWRWIMLVIRLIPEPVFKRMKL